MAFIQMFLGGINWALLVARICQLHPNALPDKLVSRFFRIYTQWRWPNPVLLCPIDEGSLGLQVWGSGTKDISHVMPIISPAYPSMNSSYNVSSSTLHIMLQEFQRGDEICEAMEAGKADWHSLFEPFSFFDAYKHYLQIDITAENEDDLRKWKGWVRSRLFQLTFKIERHTFNKLQCHPQPDEFIDKSRHLHCSYFMGLQRKQDLAANECEPFDIRLIVEEFKHSVNANTMCKPGVQPSCPSKATCESRRSSAEKSSESKQVSDGSDEGKKRKWVDDIVANNDKNAKSPATALLSAEASEGSPSVSSICIDSVIASRNQIGEAMEEQTETNLIDALVSPRNVGGLFALNEELQQSGENLSASSDARSKEAEKLGIEKLMSGPYDTNQEIPQELDELEDDFTYSDQVKESGANAYNFPLESSSANTIVTKSVNAAVASPLISLNGAGPSTTSCPNGSQEELEAGELVARFSFAAPVAQRKPLIRFNFTSIGKANSKTS